MSEAKPQKGKSSLLAWALLWVGAILIALGGTRLVTGIWSPEAAETAGASNTPVAVALIVVGAVLVAVWAWLRNR